MNTVLLLAASALAGFLVGFLLARNTWLTFEGRQARRDLHTILNLRSELERHVELLRGEKRRSAMLRGFMRKWRALARTKASTRLGHLPPLPKSVCWKCSKPATTRLGDSMYCEDCVGQRAAP